MEMNRKTARNRMCMINGCGNHNTHYYTRRVNGYSGNVWICDDCIKEMYAMIAKPAEAKETVVEATVEAVDEKPKKRKKVSE